MRNIVSDAFSLTDKQLEKCCALRLTTVDAGDPLNRRNFNPGHKLWLARGRDRAGNVFVNA